MAPKKTSPTPPHLRTADVPAAMERDTTRWTRPTGGYLGSRRLPDTWTEIQISLDNPFKVWFRFRGSVTSPITSAALHQEEDSWFYCTDAPPGWVGVWIDALVRVKGYTQKDQELGCHAGTTYSLKTRPLNQTDRQTKNWVIALIIRCVGWIRSRQSLRVMRNLVCFFFFFFSCEQPNKTFVYEEQLDNQTKTNASFSSPKFK